MKSSSPAPPPPPPYAWRSVSWLAAFFNRSPRLIQMWCHDGTLSHLPIYRDSRRRYWVAFPDEGEIALK